MKYTLTIRKMNDPVYFFSPEKRGFFDRAKTLLESGTRFDPNNLVDLTDRHFHYFTLFGFLIVWSYPK